LGKSDWDKKLTVGRSGHPDPNFERTADRMFVTTSSQLHGPELTDLSVQPQPPPMTSAHLRFSAGQVDTDDLAASSGPLEDAVLKKGNTF
jgi:hypothetical protein